MVRTFWGFSFSLLHSGDFLKYPKNCDDILGILVGLLHSGDFSPYFRKVGKRPKLKSPECALLSGDFSMTLQNIGSKLSAALLSEFISILKFLI